LSEASVHAEQASRALRCLRLFRERGVEIRPMKDGLWRVPSGSVSGRHYAVSLERESCTCADYGRRRESCKHVYAAVAAAARRGRHGAVVEVRERKGAA
jgi:hypothetical protein